MKASELKDLDLGSLVDELRDLDFDNVGGWPAPVKFLAAILVLLVVLGFGYFFVIGDIKEQLDRHQREEATLLSSFERKAFQAKNLEQYRRQLAEMESTFGELVKQLPRDTDVPELLEGITEVGVNSGLEFEVIELRSEVQQEFYVELPIAIKVVGEYHNFGSFVSGVAELKRIVTLHDFTISRPQSQQRQALGLLNLDITAKTYRYLSSDEGSDVPSGRRS